MKPEEASVVTNFHGGSITGVDVCPNSHLAASCGSDGTVRCWDYTKQASLFQTRFSRENDKGETLTCGATALRWVPLKADPSARSVTVGFINGVVRVLMRGKDDWKPLQVFKPHKKEVTDIQFSDDGTLLATASLDGTVFFHRVKRPSDLISTEYEPLLYHNLGEPVLRCNWRHDGRAVLVTCASKVTELRLPEQFKDTKVSFLTELDKSEYVFERRPVVKEPKEGEEEGEEEEEDEEEEEVKPIVHSLAYYRPGQNDFYLTIEPQCEADQGIHHCSFGIQYALKTDRGQNMNISFMHKSISGKFLLTGSDDGSVAIRTATQSRVDAFTMTSLHSRENGRVNQAVMSYDDKFLLSAGTDSQLFVVRVKPDHIESIAWAESKKDADAKTKAALEQPYDDLSSFDSGIGEGKELDVTIADFPQLPDIVKDSKYTLEESLLKTEEDRRKNEAEIKKERVRAQVRALQRTLSNIRERNDKLAPRARLPEKGFEVDPEAVRLLEVKRKEKLEEIRQMYQFDLLQSKIALQKLQARFLDQVEVESIVLRAFGTKHSVCSFRQQRLSPEFKAALARVYEANKADAESKEKDAAEGGESDAQTKEKDDHAEETAKKQAKANKKGKKKQSQWEVRKELRKIRTAKMKALMRQKPKLDTVDPQDVADLQEADDTMGDYKLKSGAKYVVPEHRKTNADKKHRQMVLMQFEMYKVQSAYNNRFLLLRETKSNIVELANHIMLEIDALNAQLKSEDAAASAVRSRLPLSIDIVEWPDTRQRVAQESLTAFKKDNTDLWTGHVCVESSSEQVAKSPEASLAVLVPTDTVDDQQRVRARIKSKIVELEEKVDQMLSGFDNALRNLALEKCKLDIRIKTAQARFLVMYQELQLLQDFQKKDELLALRMAKNTKDADAARTSIIEVEGKLEAKMSELSVWQGKSNENMEEFENLVGPQSKFHKPLLKIFKRRIKRRKDANDVEGEAADSETESESDSDDEDYSDDDEEEICPNGCDQDLYDKVRELRERRLDTEEILNNFQKEVDDLKKQRDRFLQRQKQIVKDVEGTKLEMQSFQNEKQRGMNELDIVLAIPISETRCLSADKVPDQVEELLFFPSDRFKVMQARKDELVEEKKKLWMKYKEQQRRGRRLEVIKKDKEKIISHLNDKCTDLQMLKFGQIIDLNSLDRMAVSSSVVDLKEKIRVQEQKNELLVNSEKRKLKKAAQELMQVTHANTQKLSKIGDLTERMHSLQLALDAGTDESNIVSAEDPSASKDARERRKLVHLVRLQAREVDALKTEIQLLRRKGGHMYAGGS